MRKPSELVVPSLTLAVAVVALAGSAGAAAPAPAPQQGSAQEAPMNLQVLPADMDRRAVFNVMRGFATGLGVRCEFCHVGEPGADLNTFDFASDEKHHKEVARTMLRMVMAINDTHLAELDEHGADGHGERLRVTCATCHHGQSRPVTIESVLSEAHHEGGAAALSAEYDRLRSEYYGSWTYDFSERMLLNVAGEIAAAGNVDDALMVIDKNLEAFPDSTSSYGSKGQILARAGRIDEAKAAFQACLDVDPDMSFCKDALERISGQ